MIQHGRNKRASRGPHRIRIGGRAQLACINCKERKLKGTCDDQVPSCANCQRFKLTCLLEDPTTKRHQPRNYLETLEARVALLEDQLRQTRPDSLGSHASQAFNDRNSGPSSTFKLRDENDGASDLSSKVGMLGLTMDGVEPRYLGASSAFAFSRLIHPSLRQVISGNHFGVCGWCATLTQYWVSIGAQLYIDDVLSRDNLEAIQAILCCAMYSLRSSSGPSIWKLSGLALRQCVELGYHRNAKRFGSTTDPLRLELQKRVFWCAYGIDCSAALTLGRPLGLPLQEVDAEFPMDIDDSCITESGILGVSRHSSDDSPTTMSTAIHVFRLHCLWARIHASLFSDLKSSSPNPTTYGMRIEQLRTELETWITYIPPIPPRVGAALSIFASRDWYDLNYSGTIILLYGGQLTSRRGVDDSVFVECAQAAESICHGYRRRYISKPVNYTWGTLHVLFMAGLTYLHCLWVSPSVRRDVRYDDISTTFTNCTMLLAVMAERWKSAESYRDIFEALASRTMTMMVNKNHEQWMLLTPSTLSHPSVPKDLTQWMADIADVGMSGGIDKALVDLIDVFTSQEQETDHLELSLGETGAENFL